MSPGQYVTINSDKERDLLLEHLELNTNTYWEEGVKPTQYIPRTLEYPYVVSVRGSQLFASQSLKEIPLSKFRNSGINVKSVLENIEKLN